MPGVSFSAVVPFALGVFALQGILMVVDEFRFHRRRQIPRWERIGHPLDTITVLTPLSITLWARPTVSWMTAFLALAVFSCLFVTKDEWVHARHCRPGEQWVHAVLFLLHPLVFFAMFVLWRSGDTGLLVAQTCLVTAFLTWQTLYWNGPWAASPRNTP